MTNDVMQLQKVPS